MRERLRRLTTKLSCPPSSELNAGSIAATEVERQNARWAGRVNCGSTELAEVGALFGASPTYAGCVPLGMSRRRTKSHATPIFSISQIT
jgi:hypothetical protein